VSNVKNRYGREKTCANITGDLNQKGLGISASTVWRVLRKAGYKKTKLTGKPGLTKEMREERLAWCLAYFVLVLLPCSLSTL
jgi:hypothetical protein